MTAQDIINTVYQKLSEQRARSVDGMGFCVYRGENGNKCAVGHLIPDEVYEDRFERSRVHDLLDIVTLNGNDLQRQWAEQLMPHAILLTHLQFAHDSQFSADWNQSQFDADIDTLCEEFGLDSPVGTTK